MNVPVNIGEFHVLQKLGNGAFSTVYLAVHEPTGLKVAIKDIQIHATMDSSMKTHLVREINLVKSAKSNFIAELFDVIEAPEHVYLVLEYVENGNIAQNIAKVGLLNGEQARTMIAQMVIILCYLHNHLHIAHRDIKAENVLIDKFWNIKLVDFGLCNHFSTPEQNFRSVCGSIQYLAPEIVKNKPYTKAVDIWSTGILIYKIVTGRFPFEDISMQLLLHKITSSKLSFPPGMDPDLVDLLQKMLSKDPKNRITAEQMKLHPYLKNFDFDQLDNIPEEVHDNEIKELAKERNIDFALIESDEVGILFKILQKEVQNSKIRKVQKPLKETEKKKVVRDKKKFYFLDSKKPDQMKVLAKKFVHGKIIPHRASVALSDANISDNTERTNVPKRKSEMST
ncbi:CAMK family protein kinase [Tritrichomonas foetus]|uniref:CAMK family protein kinase n=1 Tax=Tritrichomonas foetus TaxID=1144522 RepID=A0A1J4K6X3_9EUKA|nr:CAMK family protein kinase [Tritrichomonas foetus]|eukprot:OHT05213.1 CAMK family protein kinase [Tritrichomonas foetus]